MRKKVILITGANGEVGHGLISRLAEMGNREILAFDIQKLDRELRPMASAAIVGDILDNTLLSRINSEYAINEIYHLAALLSTRAEFTPEMAHRVNVEGTINLLKMAIEQSRQHGEPVKFLFPSSVAAYGMPDLKTKTAIGAVTEWEHNHPRTMYGCNKLYCEQLGYYYSNFYQQLAATTDPHGVDFRAVRFPGLISAVTLPSGGTSDYAPEMIHAAARNQTYQSFVRPDTKIPFMAMPDAIAALLKLAAAPEERLSQRVYNITSFSLSAEEIAALVRESFPGAQITFNPDVKRQTIVDSWPEDMDDALARKNWNWQPEYDAERTFKEYLAPTIKAYYADKQ